MQHLSGKSDVVVILLTHAPKYTNTRPAVSGVTTTSAATCKKYVGAAALGRSRGQGAGGRNGRVRQEVGEAEGGTAWCIPLQMTHSLTSP